MDTGVDVNSEVVDVVGVGTVTTVVDAGIGVDASALGTISAEDEAVTCPSGSSVGTTPGPGAKPMS